LKWKYFFCSNLEYAVMLRHEASASDENDASYLSMAGSLKKIATKSRATIATIY
jgi:hypothetical protein